MLIKLEEKGEHIYGSIASHSQNHLALYLAKPTRVFQWQTKKSQNKAEECHEKEDEHRMNNL